MGRTSPFTLYSLLLLGSVVVSGGFFVATPVPSLSFLVGIMLDRLLCQEQAGQFHDALLLPV